MENPDTGNKALNREGVASSEDVRKALEAQQAELNDIAYKAERALSAAGGSYQAAIEAAEAVGDTLLAEKLTVMHNVNAKEA